ncbi:MAG: hypothetical protein GX208_06620 [Firmicutes bacterium]|nr:hypothetical protein [Bacillota bacterium]
MIINRKLMFFIGMIIIFVILLVSYNLQKEKSIKLKDDLQAKEDQKARIQLDDNELDLLARAVHAEAKGEPYEGQVAVAAVILNRVAHPEFPNTIAGVLYEPLAFQIVANGTINQPADQLAIQAATEAINGVDPTNGALYFFNPAKTSNQWIRSRPVVKTIGKHVFAL